MAKREQEPVNLGDVPAAMRNLFQAQMELGLGVFRALTGGALGNVASDAKRFYAPKLGPRGGCSCHLPPPCWMPQPLGECLSHVSPCHSACLELVVTNCDRVKRNIVVVADQKRDLVTVSPSSLSLGPMQRGVIKVCYAVPDEARPGSREELLVWVRGCKEHFLRWTISIGTLGVDSCHEIQVDDCPDLVHHWYDHFYCARPCPHGGRSVPGLTQSPGTTPPAADPKLDLTESAAG